MGAAIAASRLVVAEVPPLTLALLRYAIGLLCLLPAALWSFRAVALEGRSLSAIKNIAKKDLLAMAALGASQFGLLIALLNYGLQHLGAAQAALIFSLFPLLTLALSAALGREQASRRLLVGVLLSVAGVALSLAPKLAARPALGGLSSGGWWGELAVLAAATTGALCSVLYRPYLRRYPTVPVSAFAMLASVGVLAVLAMAEHWTQRVAHLSTQAWVVTGFIGLSSGVGYFLWLYALKHESPTRVTVFLALNPVTAAVLGWAWLGEPLQAASLGALGLIAAGLWLATRPATAQEMSAARR
ncbi:MAG: DMT family transporter [Ramlibacter sp.]|nr:DMT family transporter [Ramlibacter sp.]MBX3659348.1 DMT family transporter [Ramlibacter sp.]